MAVTLRAVVNQVMEWSYRSVRDHADPFNDLTVDLVVSRGEASWRVPAFWGGGREWRVRFAAPAPGSYRFRTECSDPADGGLHGLEGVLEAIPYEGSNPLLAHGPLKVSPDRRRFQHEDGRLFFWLGDTWWMGLCKRLVWPDDFLRLTADRVAKGFTVIQIVAGLSPDMPAFDSRGDNEAGWPWEKGFTRINPAYFDMADLRIQWLVRSGLVPCILGCWGYYLKFMGLERMKQHWRYLIARWGAYPVVWCLAGEGAMPYYLSPAREADRAEQIAGWTDVARHVRATDPWNRLVTIHPTHRARDQVQDTAVLDFEMLQTGHAGHRSVPNHFKELLAALQREPAMPVLAGEVNYEGLIHGTQDEIQRLLFWGSILSGAAGHTYGANGIWQVNTAARPFGASPHGGTWGNLPWEDAYRLPGSAQTGLAKRLFERYEWWRFESHPEWVEPPANAEEGWGPFAGGIPRAVRVIYLYHGSPWMRTKAVRGIETGVGYKAFWFDPRTGNEHPLGLAEAAPDGSWPVPMPPTMDDWVLVLEAR